MNGLERTYQFLETTPNEASLKVLVPALRTEQREVRARAITALLKRGSKKGCESLVHHWDALGVEDRLLIMGGGQPLLEAVGGALQDHDEAMILRGIEMTQTLLLHPLFPQLIRRAESAASYAVRRAALDVVLQFASEEGAAARSDRDRPATRGPMVRALARSVKHFPVHRNLGIVDALLSVSTWTDSELNALLSKDSESQPVLLERFRESTVPGVLELLADAVHRRRLSGPLEQIIVSRTDLAFRDRFLDAFSCNPSLTVRKNIAMMGVPACCLQPTTLPQDLPATRRCALALVYAATETDAMLTLEMVLDALEVADPAAAMGLMHALHRFPPLEADRVFHAAVSLVADDEYSHASESDRILLSRMLALLDVHDSPFAAPIREILSALKIDEVMPRFAGLPATTRRRLGQMVLQVDPDAMATVVDQLRHPVMQRRLDAIQATIALDAVDRLAEPLIRGAMEDHMEARIHATAALAFGHGDTVAAALHELAHGPDSSVRDAAINALQQWADAT